jgi:hypothetical protein
MRTTLGRIAFATLSKASESALASGDGSSLGVTLPASERFAAGKAGELGADGGGTGPA